MRVLVLGSGGREHALAWRLHRDSDVSALVMAPGNPGMADLGPCVPLDLDNPEAGLDLARRERIDLTVVGPEAALDRGVADAFRIDGRAIVGPSRRGSALESSKAFAKDFMQRHGIPTARYLVVDDPARGLEAVAGNEFGLPVVIKADGLAAGKGVVIAATREDAEAAVRAAMVDRQFGAAGARLVIEECLDGPEVSFFVLCDGKRAVRLLTAQDHKRIFDDDRGPNTGGMGAFAPSPLIDASISAAVMRDVVTPVILGFAKDADPYIGFLYVSLMLTSDGPKVIEFNVRFGDPEAQVVMPLLTGSFASLLYKSATGALDESEAPAANACAVGVVLASAGYPASPDSGREIHGLDAASTKTDVHVFHAGTRVENGRLVTAGGRVLTVVGVDATYQGAMARAYDAAAVIRFEGKQFRTDIGRKALLT